jgi:SAM-dependent methyltransferase/uncharacterized protein YbaR (Trm112 family)
VNPELLERAGLVCPACRGRRRPDDPHCTIVLDEVFERSGNDVVQGLLRCNCPDCRAGFPIVDGVPIVFRDMVGWWRDQRSHVAARPQLDSRLCDLFDLLDRRVQVHQEDHRALNLYLDAHYGRPSPPGPLPWMAELQDRYWATVNGMIAGEEPIDGTALDLGCAVGRFTFELARVSDLAVGLDIQFPFVRQAVRIQREGRCTVDRQIGGQWGHAATLTAEPADNVLFLVADALDPPFCAEAWDRVAALNLLDNVAYPTVLLGQMDALLKPGGDMLLASPYEWQAGFTEPQEWLVDPEMTSADVVRAILTDRWRLKLGLNHRIIDEVAELPWVLRRHDHHWAVFLVHLLRSRKTSG